MQVGYGDVQVTIITSGSKIWRVKYTQHTLTLSEELGYDITGKEFVEGAVGSGFVRGYVMVDLAGGIGQIKRGPITLLSDDLELVTYEARK